MPNLDVHSEPCYVVNPATDDGSYGSGVRTRSILFFSGIVLDALPRANLAIVASYLAQE